jgi:NitT/TauT family transport system permease protein
MTVVDPASASPAETADQNEVPATGQAGLVDPATSAAPVGDAPSPRDNSGPSVERRTRGRRHSQLLSIRAELDRRWMFILGAVGVVLMGVVWAVGAVLMDDPKFLPTPAATWSALADLAADGSLQTDTWASLQRILIGYAISVLIGIVVGLAVGSYSAVNAFLEPQMAFLRYIPAGALIALFMVWFGIGETPKIMLIVVGTVFFNILMMADVARSVPRELLNAAYTLGAGRWKVMRKVIFRWSTPGIIDAARVNLAAAWLMLVVAEIVAAESGLAYQINRALRARSVDKMFALLLVFGIIGLVSDMALRWLRNVVAPWAKS